MVPWARCFSKLYGKGYPGHIETTFSTCLPYPGSCLGGRMRLPDPATKYKVSAVAVQEGFERETINQVLKLSPT